MKPAQAPPPEPTGVKLVAYCDGSNRPVGVYSGYGVFGYVYTDSVRPKNTKHPSKAALRFTPTGITKEKSDAPITVLSFLEVIGAVPGNVTSNNEAELKAVLCALEKASEIPDLKSVSIITDSNYIVSVFNENLKRWIEAGWKRQDGKTIVHLDEWQAIQTYQTQFEEKGIQLTLTWVKGHSDDYGNHLSDLFSGIGSNAARIQYDDPTTEYVERVLDRQLTYAEYKASYDVKDFIYHFKDIFFSSSNLDDTWYCFLSNDEDERNNGMRHNTSIFLGIHGYVPKLIQDLKAFYRSLRRNYVVTCSIKLAKLSNRDILRLGEVLPVSYLVREYGNRHTNQYALVGEDTVLLQENTTDFPFIANITRIASHLYNIQDDISQQTMLVKDVTDIFMSEGKLKLTNLDNYLDLGYLVEGDVVFKQKLLVHTGYDFPSYLALKNIETTIQRVEMLLHRQSDSNFYTVYMRITTTDRCIYSLNVLNKYLAVSF